MVLREPGFLIPFLVYAGNTRMMAVAVRTVWLLQRCSMHFRAIRSTFNSRKFDVEFAFWYGPQTFGCEVSKVSAPSYICCVDKDLLHML